MCFGSEKRAEYCSDVRVAAVQYRVVLVVEGRRKGLDRRANSRPMLNHVGRGINRVFDCVSHGNNAFTMNQNKYV